MWPQTAKQEGGKMIKEQFGVIYGKKQIERPKVEGVSTNTINRSRSGAPSPKECAVNGQMTKASNN